jgi:transcriptional regulator with XRE-family HTH domain
METLGSRIDHAISRSGKTIAEVAKACDVSVQAIYTWMRNGVKDLRNDNLFALADITGFEARWIGTGKGPQKTGDDTRKATLDSIYAKLDDRGKKAVLRVAEAEATYTITT